MNQKPKVTFLIPCYNTEKYLIEALECIVNQTYENLEIILIDDGSTDNTLRLLKKYEQRDSRIRLYKNETNIGLIKTLNKGIELATGEYIARFDADDLIGLDRIEKQIEIIIKNNNIDLITSYVNYITPSGKFHSKVESFYCYTFNSIKFLNLFECPLVHAGMLIKSSILKQQKYTYDISYLHIEDYKLFSELLNKNINIFVNTSNSQKYFYRRNLSSVSNRNREIQVENAIQLSINNLKNLLEYTIEYDVLKAIILKCSVNWNVNLIKKVFYNFLTIKNIYLQKHANNLSSLDIKLIQEWYYLRCLKIVTTLLLKGNLACKLLGCYYFLYNIKFLQYKKFYLNISSRLVYIFNSIKYQN